MSTKFQIKQRERLVKHFWLHFLRVSSFNLIVFNFRTVATVSANFFQTFEKEIQFENSRMQFSNILLSGNTKYLIVQHTHQTWVDSVILISAGAQGLLVLKFIRRRLFLRKIYPSKQVNFVTGEQMYEKSYNTMKNIKEFLKSSNFSYSFSPWAIPTW